MSRAALLARMNSRCHHLRKMASCRPCQGLTGSVWEQLSIFAELEKQAAREAIRFRFARSRFLGCLLAPSKALMGLTIEGWVRQNYFPENWAIGRDRVRIERARMQALSEMPSAEAPTMKPVGSKPSWATW